MLPASAETGLQEEVCPTLLLQFRTRINILIRGIIPPIRKRYIGWVSNP